MTMWKRFWLTIVGALLMVPALAIAQDDISKEDFFREGSAPVRKPANYDVTILYFMDYQCPSCRQYTPDVTRVLAEDRKVRVIYRDTPLLGERSEQAARAAIASAFQGKHERFHHALMTTKGPIDEVALRGAAEKAGIDWARLQRDLVTRKAEIQGTIERNIQLSEATGIAGTPAFVVGDSLANGALDYAGLKGMIADARSEANATRPKSEPTASEIAPLEPSAPAATNDVAAMVPTETTADVPAAAKTPAPVFNRVTPPPPGQKSGLRFPLLFAAPALAATVAGLLLWRRRGCA